MAAIAGEAKALVSSAAGPELEWRANKPAAKVDAGKENSIDMDDLLDCLLDDFEGGVTLDRVELPRPVPLSVMCQVLGIIWDSEGKDISYN